uniref:Uncharacterized protein n=1 Tax=Aegilops tauschii subsp. strangulata TaxID=200361 RepID=A0A453K2T4_AEGTS
MDSRSINLRGFAGSAGKNIMQGIGGFVFGNEASESKEDSYVERFLDRISNGTMPDDRRSAMTELQSLVAESRSAQMSFGAMGFPVLLNVLKEDREDVELVRGALETLVSALTPIETSQGLKTEVQPASMNSDLLSRETDNISLLLSLLVSLHSLLLLHVTRFTCFICHDLFLPPVWFKDRGGFLCAILHNPAFNSVTYKLVEKITGGNSINSPWHNSFNGHAYGPRGHKE